MITEAKRSKLIAKREQLRRDYNDEEKKLKRTMNRIKKINNKLTDNTEWGKILKSIPIGSVVYVPIGKKNISTSEVVREMNTVYNVARIKKINITIRVILHDGKKCLCIWRQGILPYEKVTVNKK